MARKRPSVAVFEDLHLVPDNLVGEIIDGTLYTSPRPAIPHASATFRLATDFESVFGQGRSGSGDWYFLFEPGLHLEGAAEIVPDIAGWRVERVEAHDGELVELVPDWICEVLSPSTMKTDRTIKKPYYARVGLPWLWFLDPLEKTLEVFKGTKGKWTDHQVFTDAGKVKADPFGTFALDVDEIFGPAALRKPRKKR